jgi:hypothetical protein
MTFVRKVLLSVVVALIVSVVAVWSVTAQPNRQVRLADQVCLGFGGSGTGPVACIPV